MAQLALQYSALNQCATREAENITLSKNMRTPVGKRYAEILKFPKKNIVS
jgi:hypothetical protein